MKPFRGIVLALMAVLLMACGPKTTAPSPDVALLKAAEDGKMSTVVSLLSTGANVDARDQYQRTPLMLASLHGHVEVVRRLLSAGADIYATGAYGGTPLIFARRAGHETVIELLLEAGAEEE